MYKVCSTCGEEKLLSAFRKDKTQKSGRQPRCKVCARAYINANYKRYKEKTVSRNAERMKKMRQRLNEYKAQQKCFFCKEDEIVCLDFHHVDPSTKDLQLSHVTTQSWDTIMEEVKKCIVVCKNCHAKIHAGIINYGPMV